MAEQSGPSMAAIAATGAALSARHDTAAGADRVLTEAVRAAYRVALAARRRIDTVAAEIDDCAAHPAGFAADTPLGARELQKALIAKQRELIAIVAGAQRDDDARRALLESLRPQYSGELSR